MPLSAQKCENIAIFMLKYAPKLSIALKWTFVVSV